MTAAVSPSMIPVAGAAFVRPLTNGGGIRLYGSSSGYVGIKPASAAGSTDYTLPSSPPSADGQVLIGTTAGVLSWATASGASPSGSGTELQYRSGASTFGAVTGSSTANGGITIQSQSVSAVPLSVSLASGQTANALEINSYGGSGGNRWLVDAYGQMTVGPTANIGVGLIHRFYDGYGNNVVAVGNNYQIVLSGGGGGNNGIRHDSQGYCLGKYSALTGNSTFRLQWSNGSNWYDSVDTAIVRNAAGVVEINNGTAGTYRDLKLRSLYSVAGAATDVPISVSLASGHTANALEINSYGGSGGDKFRITAGGVMRLAHSVDHFTVTLSGYATTISTAYDLTLNPGSTILLSKARGVNANATSLGKDGLWIGAYTTGVTHAGISMTARLIDNAAPLHLVLGAQSAMSGALTYRNGGKAYMYGGLGVAGGTDGDVILCHNGTSAIGNVIIGTSAAVEMLTVAGRAFLSNQSEPSTPTGGGVLYVESGALKYKGSSGTVTTLGAA